MKLVVAIVNKDDSSYLSKTLSKAGFFSTKLTTSGGFLMSENHTMLIGVEDESVNDVIKILEETCKTRRALIPSSVADFYPVGGHLNMPMEVTVGGATIFILDVDRFLKF